MDSVGCGLSSWPYLGQALSQPCARVRPSLGRRRPISTCARPNLGGFGRSWPCTKASAGLDSLGQTLRVISDALCPMCAKFRCEAEDASVHLDARLAQLARASFSAGALGGQLRQNSIREPTWLLCAAPRGGAELGGSLSALWRHSEAPNVSAGICRVTLGYVRRVSVHRPAGVAAPRFRHSVWRA